MKRAAITLLTICGIEELDGHRDKRITHILSILDPGTPDPAAFARWDRHHRTVLRFHDIIEPMPNMILPERADVQAIVDFGEEIVEEVEAGGPAEHLLIHCHMGISRSTAAMLMMLAAAYPDESDDALVDRLAAIRPQAWPNIRMTGFAGEILGRPGLAAAVSRLHARQMAAKPHLADVFRGLGRTREVELALAA